MPRKRTTLQQLSESEQHLKNLKASVEKMQQAQVDTSDDLVQDALDTLQLLRIGLHSIEDQTERERLSQQCRTYERLVHQEQKRLQLLGQQQLPSSTDFKTLDQLEQARNQLIESEALAADTLINLQTQRETLQKAKNTLPLIRQEISRGGRFIDKMTSWWR